MWAHYCCITVSCTALKNSFLVVTFCCVTLSCAHPRSNLSQKCSISTFQCLHHIICYTKHQWYMLKFKSNKSLTNRHTNKFFDTIYRGVWIFSFSLICYLPNPYSLLLQGNKMVEWAKYSTAQLDSWECSKIWIIQYENFFCIF